MLNLLIRIIPPAWTTRVGISGTERTLNPLLVISSWMRFKDVLLPPHGPPVIAILQIGCSATFLMEWCSILSFRYTWFSEFQNYFTPNFDYKALLSMALSCSFSCLSLCRWQRVVATVPSRTTSVLCSSTLSTMFPMNILINMQTVPTNQPHFIHQQNNQNHTHNHNTFNNNSMRLQLLLQISLKLITIKGQNHSIIQAICREHLLDNQPNVPLLVNAFQESINKQQYSPHLLDWVNLLIFNICAFNQEKINFYDNQLLQSTEDGAKFMQKELKMQISSINITNKIRQMLKMWLQQILTLPFFQRIFAQAKLKSINKSKSLRSLLQTVDYLTSKYDIKLTQKEAISAILSTLDRKTQIALVLQRANQINKRVFHGGEELVSFLQQVASNYTVNLTQIAQIISANYQNINPTRKYFQSTHNSGEVIAQEIIDFLIRTTTKSDLFSQKMDNYRPFELLMEILLQKFGYVLIEFNGIIESLIKSQHSSIYSSQNYKKLQEIATVFSYQLENKFPQLQHLLHYTYESLLAKYTPSDSMELIKKFILNRLFLNPFYYALLHSPNESDIQKYVKIVNQLRILFYQRKIEGISETYKTDRLIQHAELLRKSLNNLIASKDQLSKSPQRLYINDTILGSLFCQINDGLKLNANYNKNVSEMHSESSLSFSLRNQSASRMQQPTSHHYIPTNPSLPHLPKPSNRTVVDRNQSQRNTNTLRNTASKIISTEVYIEAKDIPPPIEQLQELISLRRQYGELRREIQVRTLQHAKTRQKWSNNLHFSNNPIKEKMYELQAQSKQLLINSFLL